MRPLKVLLALAKAATNNSETKPNTPQLHCVTEGCWVKCESMGKWVIVKEPV